MILSILLGLTSGAHAVPLQLSQQGRMLDNSGAAVTGTHTLAVRIYDDETAGNLLWQEIMAEDFINGYYAIILGADSFNPLDDSIFASGNLHLEMELDNGGPLLPRKPIGSTPYALRAKLAEGIDGGDVNANSVSIAGGLVIDGNGDWVGPTPTLNWSDLANVPGDIADGDDDSLASIACNPGEILGWNGSAWGCAADNGLTESEVEAFVTNDPLDLASGTTIGGDVIVTASTLGDTLGNSSCNQGEILSYDQVSGTWTCSVDNSLTESQVEAFVENDALNLAAGTQMAGSNLLTTATLGDTLGNTACGQGEILTYDLANGWACTNFSQMLDADNDGVLSWNDCDDSNPALLGMSIDADCDGAITGIDCDDSDANSTTQINDADCDTYTTLLDCNDNNADMPANDMDCDGVATADDCDDNDPAMWDIGLDADCDGTQTALDCDDNDPNSNTQANDADCDGYVTMSDCNDSDPNMPGNDMDCDGVATADDCDDNDAALLAQADDNDCDGALAGLDCDDNDASNTSTSNCGVFSSCVNNWCYQQGTMDQYTKCDSVSNSGSTCHNPEIKYGTLEGGVPHEHGSNDYNAWCQQLGGSSGSASYGQRTGGKLFWCSGYDESTHHWCDWSDGYWHSQSFGYGGSYSSGNFVTTVTCN